MTTKMLASIVMMTPLIACDATAPPSSESAELVLDSGGPTPGPLEINPRRSTVFRDHDGRAVWLAGMSVAGSDDGKKFGQWPLVSAAAIDQLSDANGNFVHIRLGPSVRSVEGPEYEAYQYAGGGRYDLTRWNDPFWDRVRNAVSYARDHGVYVEIDLIDAWAMKVAGRSPWHAGFNTNNVAYDCGHMLTADPSIRRDWLNKIVDEIGDYDNVLFQIGNETSTCGQMGTSAWESFVANTVQARLGPGRPRLIATNSENPGLEGASYVGYVNRHNPADGPPIAIDLIGTKPMGVNEYGDGTPDGFNEQLWRAFAKGTYLHYWWGEDRASDRLATFDRIGFFLGQIGRTDFAGFDRVPIVNGRLVGRRDVEYVGFLPDVSSLHIAALGAATDAFDVRWVNPLAHRLWTTDTVPGGARDFARPADDPGATVLRVVKRNTPHGIWLDETFEGLASGALHGQHGWSVEERGPTVSGGVIIVDPPTGKRVRIGRDVAIVRTGKHRLDARAMVVDAMPDQASMAKVEVRTSARDSLDPKLQIYFGTSMRVRHGATETVIVTSTVPNRWYRIRCDIDMDAHPNKLDVYVDDTLARSGIALPDGAITDVAIAGEDMPGRVLIDELRGSEVRFYDVPGWSPYHDAIDKVAQRGIAGGCSLAPPLFCPDAALSRAQAAVFLLTAEHGSGYQPPDPVGLFQDVPTTSVYARWIERLYAEGITGGCASNPRRFCPDDPVSREQIAVFLLLARWGTAFVPPAPIGRFDDVPTTSPYARWIEELAREGITAGCSPTTFCPHDVVTRGPMSAFTVATWGL